MNRRLATLAGSVALTLVTSAAWAYWSADSTPGSNGAAAATTVNQGATPSASVVGATVTVTWAASALASGQAVSGYQVRRYDAGTSALQTVLPACTGTIAGTSCAESDVPNGTWKYTVTPVFATNWQGQESALSPTVTVNVDRTAPTNSITLSSVTGGAHLAGTTLYYRGLAAGSVRLTNAVADAGSGPASSATAALTGTTTGWTHAASTVSTPTGGPYVSNPFAWTAGTTTGPGETVTGRDVTGNTATTTLTFVNDSTAPSGSITYGDGPAASPSITVTFSASDAGSGVASRQLQRATAAYTGSSCGAFSSFANFGPANPTSPYNDTSVGAGTCYKYQYVVNDQVGNQLIATSSNVARIDYAGAVDATAGLLSHWRLGEPAASLTASDSFTGSTGALLTSRAGEMGSTWTLQAGTANLETISAQGHAYRNGAGYAIYRASAVPSSADYSVEADLVVKSGLPATLPGEMAGVTGRINTATNQFYMARWEEVDNSWNIVKYDNGTVSWPAYVPGEPDLVVGHAYRVRLEMSGSTTTTLRLYVNGVLKVTATDTSVPFTGAGRAGIMDGNSAASTTKSSTTGLHFENFQVTPSSYPRAVDSKGSNTGDYKNGPTRGEAGALVGDSNTATTFDGVNDYVQMTGTTGFPTGASVRSTELWFKTSSAARQVLFRYGSGATSQEYGLWLAAGGTAMEAWGFGGGQDKTFNLSSAVNNGVWHHVVLTFNGSVLTLYVDGAALPAQAATRDTVMDAYGFNIGAVVRPNDASSGGFFTGSIDEVSFYTSVLTSTQVADRYALGTAVTDTTGPTGGSIDATGLTGTGSRYSTSTTLSLALAAGTDPSGVATSGNQVLRATATLTNGTCGAFGAYTLLTGGNDPASPLADTVTDQACYSYEYVVHDALGNATTYTSPQIKVDATAPAAPTLTFSAFTNTWWPGSGSTVYYRSAATSGSFTATASASDTASGIASYTFPALGTNWTSTPGALGVDTYSWAGAPAAPGTKNVTATNSAGLVSANTPFTMTADDTPPTAGTVTYANGNTTATSLSVSFTTGTDAASGVGRRLLQRGTAPLTGTTCGTYGSFATVVGGTGPTSPFTDAVTAGSCYRYRYVVTDRVGNSHVATSANVVKVFPTYVASVSGTAGLLSHYRLGEDTISSDAMSGTTGAALQSRSGGAGTSWTKHGLSDADAVLTAAGRLRKAGASTWNAVYHTSGVPASADYSVEADLFVASNLLDDGAGVIGRMNTTLNAETYYLARYEQSTQTWALYRRLNGSWDWLGASAASVTPGATYRLTLEMTGTSIRVLVDGVQRVSATDTAIPAAGRGGLALGLGGAATTVSDTTGIHLDSFQISPPMADSAGTNHGRYLGGVQTGQTGAILGDADTAALFDGTNDFGTVTRQIQDDFSIELWFRSTQGIGTGAQWWSGAGLVDGDVAGAANDFGISLRSDGRVVAGVGTPDVSVVSSTGGFNNGAWHHVVFTRARTSGALTLYVDGVAVGTATGSTLSLTTPSVINFGRIQSGTNHLAGSLDEVAVYSTVLSGATVAAHHAAGTS